MDSQCVVYSALGAIESRLAESDERCEVTGLGYPSFDPHRYPSSIVRDCATVVTMESASDPFNLQRFVDAQARVYRTVVDELRAGRKRSHWIWFIFPQLAGLGSSPTAVRYAIGSLDEARAYLRHNMLGPRLRECTRLVTAVQGRSIEEIFGFPDDLKVRSS